MRNKISLALVMAVLLASAGFAAAQEERFSQEQFEVIAVFMAQGRALEEQDMDLWGEITMPEVVIKGQATEQYDMFMAELDRARAEPEAAAKAHDPAGVQDVVILGDEAGLYYLDENELVTEFTYVLENGRWRLSQVW